MKHGWPSQGDTIEVHWGGRWRLATVMSGNAAEVYSFTAHLATTGVDVKCAFQCGGGSYQVWRFHKQSR
jgi:hypothetical protein